MTNCPDCGRQMETGFSTITHGKLGQYDVADDFRVDAAWTTTYCTECGPPEILREDIHCER